MSKAKILADTVSAGGVLADGAVSAAEVSGLAAVATSGAYGDLSGKPSIPAALISGTTIKTINGGSLLGAGDVAITGTPGVNYQQFSSSATWTKPSGYAAGSRVLLECWGGGGSGAKLSYANCGIFQQGGGGGGGAYNSRWVLLSEMGATETITVGAGGAARTENDTTGIVGGTTSIGSLAFAYGGGGGRSGGGGGGGGQLSAGGSDSGQPYAGERNTAQNIKPEGAPGVFGTSSDKANGVSSLFKGGGGGGTWYDNGVNGYGGNGAAAVWGGGGGGGGSLGVVGSGGVSSYGGSGGAGSTSGTATSGIQPGGGGGGTRTGTSGAGAAGSVRITVFAGI